ncbi:uncharacterized protein LOC118406010 [Branchiostoma floridae]|uniref:Uncharacterized protein LOC118406010 n=1 Tax=Branchiostoma floridae TaxID=7739 RepID=A0A9J7HLP1_BRAFL|nr:uncharacterized protein LOC118406010 [Branchiostoma floridae]
MPNGGMPIEEYREQLEVLRELYRKYENDGEVMIIGDFNADLGDQGGPRGKDQMSKLGKELADIMGELGLLSLNLSNLGTGPLHTFQANGDKNLSTIDHIVIPHTLAAEATSCRVLENNGDNLSDHNPVIATFNNKPSEWKEGQCEAKLDWEKVERQVIEDTFGKSVERKLEATKSPSEVTIAAIEEEVGVLTEVLTSAAVETIPVKRTKKHQKPYWSTDLRETHQEEIEAWLLWKAAGKPREKNNQLFKNYKDSKSRYRAVLRQAKLLHKEQENEKLAEIAGADDRGFSKKIRQRKGKIDKPQAVKVGDQLLTDPREVREAWATHFEVLGNEQKEESALYDEVHKESVIEEVRKMERESYDNTEDILEEPFLLSEVATVCCQLKCGKAGGNDGLTYEHMKYGGKALWSRMTALFNAMRELEYIPMEFKKGIKIPLLKQGKTNKADFNSHRGITLLNVMMKIWEKVLYNRWKPWLLSKGLPHELQNGGQVGCNNITTA